MLTWSDETSPSTLLAAIQIAREALGRHDSLTVRLQLSWCLVKMGRLEEAVDVLQEALGPFPASLQVRLILADTLLQLGRPLEAEPHVQAAVDLQPDNRFALRLRFDVLTALGQDPARFGAQIPSGAVHWRAMERGARRDAPLDTIEACDRELAADPGHTNARYLKALALAASGQADQAVRTMALERLLDVRDMPAPDNFESAPAFRAAVAREILANPTLTADPALTATRGGRQTRCLLQPGNTALAALLREIRSYVDLYVRRLSEGRDEFAAGAPNRARLYAWAVVYRAGGRQESHRHPHGWLSGVFYVSGALSADGSYAGPLLAGALEARSPFEPPWGVRRIEPVPGRLVLFPSFVPHATEACDAEDQRICVSFDVVPVRKEME